ncbi:4'-phosphopantetheinyl transferase family protein [Bosea sp. PAMC 26642]|uniref:4'-phosphopantetheinyl transferase family protein n=1 Tax=Bosea sp. (strain PAMC 26642) TaxID=1792307 RepID=UPI00076FEAFF|nr:4'-phosphopantetheinyl transferase superfamily protein [Bosea sp. PAMC 26642]AMJ59038.1 hypothetical protein AXW83_00870 [Bosea sp. PAMC 26642]
MIWLDSPDAPAPSLPAVWLITTGARPTDLAQRSALRRQVAQSVIARHLHIRKDAVAIGHDRHGRPLLAAPAATGLHLSLATRAGVVAVALAEQAVGVDVELVDDAAAMPLDSLHTQERTGLSALLAHDRRRAFAGLWAAKEAYVKALGSGFVRPPESFCVSLRPNGCFAVDDPLRAVAHCAGRWRLTRNGGQDELAAAVIVLDRP